MLPLLLAVPLTRDAAGQHAAEQMHAEAHAAPAPLGLSPNRSGSGTSWLPDSTPVYGAHLQLGRWKLMGHGNLFAGLDAQGSDRGAFELVSTNWLMGMLSGPLGGGEASARAMLSAEPWTVRHGGYPLLLQTGESFEGQPLHDRQHPHDLFMELALAYGHELTDRVAAAVYLGLPGEPALGPCAYPHRISAWFAPFAPLGHHWQDSTHIAFGVITAGLYSRRVRLEGSVFNGREPDEQRADLELRPLDSFSGRLQVAWDGDWSAQLSAGRLASPEQLQPEEGLTRLTASATANRRLPGQGNLASTLLWGANLAHGELTHSFLLEGSLVVPGSRQVVSGRAELVQKSGEELVLPTEEIFLVGQFSLGWRLDLLEAGPLVPGLGATGMLSVLPAGLEGFYGARLPLGAMLFVSLRPALIGPPDTPAMHP